MFSFPVSAPSDSDHFKKEKQLIYQSMNLSATQSSELRRFRDVANLQGQAVLRSDTRHGPSSSSSVWNVPSSSRCIQCGTLGCQEHKVVIDPERKRRNEEAVRMNTPFYRQKLMARFGETLEQESLARQHIKEWYAQELRVLWQEQQVDVKFFHLIASEREVRDRLLVQEKKLRHTLRTTRARDEITRELALHERECRELVEQKWIRGGGVIRDMHIDGMMLIGTLEKEVWARHALEENEAGFRAKLMRLGEECQSCLNANTRTRRMLIEACLSGRDDIALLRRDKMESFVTMFRIGEDTIAEWYRQRHELALECERVARDISVDQDAARRKLREVMAEDHEATLSLEQLLSEERTDILRHELKARLGLEADEAHSNSSIFLLMQKGVESVHEQLEKKRIARDEFDALALRHLRMLVDEEDESFSHLLAWGRESAERTQQRVVSNRRSREQLMERFREGLALLWDARCDELKALRQQMLIDEDEVQRTVEENRQSSQRFVRDALKELSRISLDELDARAEIGARREHDLEDVYRFIEYKRTERNSVAVVEADKRHKIEEQETAFRSAIFSGRANALEQSRRRFGEFVAACKQLERQIMQDRFSIEDEQDAAFLSLLRGLDDALFMTFCDEQARERQRLESHETRTRNDGTLAEVRQRDQIRLQMNSERRSFDRHLQAVWEAYVDELSVREQGDRQIIARSWLEEHEHCRMDFCREMYEVEDLIVARVKIQLLARQEYMREDPRLLDPFEEPLEECAMSIEEFRKSVQMNSPHRPSAHSQIHCQLEYVAMAIGADVRHLSMGLVSFLAEVVDAANERVLSAKDTLTRSERENGALKKGLEQIRAGELAAREQVDFYKKKLERDAKDFAEKREMEKRERSKEDARLKAEEKRGREKQAALRDANERNEQLKEKIREQYSSVRR